MAKTVVAQSLGTKFLLEARALDQVRAVVRAGGLIVYPTDTVYGLGADPFQEKAVDRLLTAKERPRDQGLSIVVADIPDVFQFGERTSIAEAFCTKNLPGPYTVVLSATPHAPRPVMSRDGKVAIRIPDHPIPRLLAKAIGPLTATSANRHGRPAPATYEAVLEELGDRVDLYIDGGPTPLGGESTVVDLSGSRPKILRQGVTPAGK
ncbi:MAG TPA: L-threonylcarbamoyladenylate synthase [Thermoplasmata archaeon]|nr:L-threonylcarbamoyladenylate synthase [Thermoplasmata archaeon]